MTQVVRPYRGVSAEARRADRRRRLLTATLLTVGRDGVHATTVDAVCSTAGLTKRYFYESFADLDALLVAVMDDLFTDLRDRMVLAARRRRSRAGRARAVVELLVDTLAGDPRLARLYVEAPGHAALRVRRDEAITAFTELLRVDILPVPTRRRAEEQRRALAIRLVVAGTTDLITGWLSGVVPGDRETIIRTVVAAGLAAGSSA